jgi:hypothetical protein
MSTYHHTIFITISQMIKRLIVYKTQQKFPFFNTIGKKKKTPVYYNYRKERRKHEMNH